MLTSNCIRQALDEERRKESVLFQKGQLLSKSRTNKYRIQTIPNPPFGILLHYLIRRCLTA